MNKGVIILFVVVIIGCVVTPLTSASDRIYDGTIVGINHDNELPVEITYRYSRRRNITVTAGICDGLSLDDLKMGMAVKWTSLGGGLYMIVGPIPETPHNEPPNDETPDNETPPSNGDTIAKITIQVENARGESLTFELSNDDWRLDDADLEINLRRNVSVLLKEPSQEKTVMFVTHISLDSKPLLKACIDKSKFNVWGWNYVFPDFPARGDYFNYQTPDSMVSEKLKGFEELGFRNVLYVDPTECDRSISGRWSDSVVESGDWWSLMTLDPSKSWYHYIKAGMLGLTERFPSIDGFAIDRLDRCRNEQEELWAARLLDEVRQEAGIPVKYVMNTLQPWMTDLASRAVFIGSDGVDTEKVHLTRTIENYGRLATHTETGRFYINPYMGKTDEELIEDFEVILEAHDFVFMDDYYLRLIDSIFPD